ncbi:hypothetical protein PM082_005346 [Marasmius tenuissimus]|nr:hypothetical protein PM082_005346 [Marasmius tenuissimus]
MQTRQHFDEACRLFIAKYASVTPSFSNSPMRGWSWNGHPMLPNLGYMSRNTTLTIKSSNEPCLVDADVTDDLEASPDEAISTTRTEIQTLACHEYVVFSATFQVPCLYFTISHPNGAPLSADEVVKTSLFHPVALASTTTTSFAVTQPNSLFPLLSQGEHPTLGTPCWYLHPCETAPAMEELLSEERADTTAEERLVRWLEVWFLVAGSVVDLRI